jgi:cobalt-zinc-cadmium efflux system outer membrane protein
VRSRTRELLTRAKLLHARLEQFSKVLLPLEERSLTESQKHYNAMFIGAFQLFEAKHRQIQHTIEYHQSLEEYWLTQAMLESLLWGALPVELDQGE